MSTAELDRKRKLETDKKRRYRAKLNEQSPTTTQALREADSEQHRIARADQSPTTTQALREANSDQHRIARANQSEGEAANIRRMNAERKVTEREIAHSQDPFYGWERDPHLAQLRFWAMNENGTNVGQKFIAHRTKFEYIDLPDGSIEEKNSITRAGKAKATYRDGSTFTGE